MAFFTIRSSKTGPPRAGRGTAPGPSSCPMPSELEGRTLLSTLTVVNDQDSGPGSLPRKSPSPASGDTIAFAPSLAGQTIHLTSPLSFNGSLTFDGSRAGGLSIVG